MSRNRPIRCSRRHSKHRRCCSSPVRKRPSLFTNFIHGFKHTTESIWSSRWYLLRPIYSRSISTRTRIGNGVSCWWFNRLSTKIPIWYLVIKGTYNRTGSIGALNSGSSYVYFAGTASNQYSESISWNNPSSSAMTITSASVTITFNGTAADDTAYNPTSPSGSILYAGQTITLGIASVITAQVNVSQSQFSASVANGTFSASLTNPITVQFPTAANPFGTLQLVSASLSVNLGTCGFPLIQLVGVAAGFFGKYINFTPAGTVSFDPCILPSGAWVTQSGADYRLLTILADTQAGGIENLIAPGFNGSTLSLTNPISNWNSEFSNGENGVTDIPTDFSLTLQNSNSTTPYGVYQFSLDSSDPHYITNVFGSSPTVGNPATQVAGQKIE